jgi:hypothetical protein
MDMKEREKEQPSYDHNRGEGVPSGILCGACMFLPTFMGILSVSLEFLLYASSAVCRSLKEAIFDCSLGGIEFECTIVDL